MLVSAASAAGVCAREPARLRGNDPQNRPVCPSLSLVCKVRGARDALQQLEIRAEKSLLTELLAFAQETLRNLDHVSLPHRAPRGKQFVWKDWQHSGLCAQPAACGYAPGRGPNRRRRHRGAACPDSAQQDNRFFEVRARSPPAPSRYVIVETASRRRAALTSHRPRFCGEKPAGTPPRAFPGRP